VRERSTEWDPRPATQAVARSIPACRHAPTLAGFGDAEDLRPIHLPINSPDYAAINGKMILQLPPDGNGGVGSLYGTLQVLIGGCYAEVEICDVAVEAKVSGDGSIKLRNAVQTRQLIKTGGESSPEGRIRAGISRRPRDRCLHPLSR
jgi:hypothetical protein